VASREERPRTWRAEPEATSPSGGHLPPEVDSTGLLDPLFDPLPPDQRSVDGGSRPPQNLRQARGTATRPPADIAPPPAAPARTRRVPKSRPTVRRVRRTLKRVSPLSVLRLSLFYYTIFLFVWLGFVAVVFWMVQATGAFDAWNEVSDIFFKQWKDVEITLSLVEKWALFIGIVGVIVGSIINAFLAFLYNLGADILGGLEVTFVERDL
jgi:hypothetical protein